LDFNVRRRVEKLQARYEARNAPTIVGVGFFEALVEMALLDRHGQLGVADDHQRCRGAEYGGL